MALLLTVFETPLKHKIFVCDEASADNLPIQKLALVRGAVLVLELPLSVKPIILEFALIKLAVWVILAKFEEAPSVFLPVAHLALVDRAALVNHLGRALGGVVLELALNFHLLESIVVDALAAKLRHVELPLIVGAIGKSVGALTLE